jgi:hypothetical protein
MVFKPSKSIQIGISYFLATDLVHELIAFKQDELHKNQTYSQLLAEAIVFTYDGFLDFQ